MSFLEKIQYYLIIAWFWFLSKLPLPFLFFSSEILTFFVYRLFGYRKKVVYENLILSFPEASDKEIKHIARKYYRHMSVMIIENIYFRFVPIHKLHRHLIVENTELLQQLFQKKRNVIFMLGHFGNWEVAGTLSKYLPYKLTAVYKPLSSKIFDKIYFDIRSRMGVEPVDMKEVLRKVHQMNSQPEPFGLIMVADQAPGMDKTQHWINFLNQETGVYLGSEKIARKYDMAVVYISLLRERKGVYRLKPTLITDSARTTRLHEITDHYFQLLEDSIVDAPRYWLWSHRRWKHTRKN